MAVTAKKAQKCWRCHGGIAPGDPILKQQGSWVHESCYVPKEQTSGRQALPGMALLTSVEEWQNKQKETQ